MDNAGKVNDIGLHKSNIRAQYWKQLRIWESGAKIGNTGWAQGADTHDVHLADSFLMKAAVDNVAAEVLKALLWMAVLTLKTSLRLKVIGWTLRKSCRG